MNTLYRIRNSADVFSPALLFFKQHIENNIAEAVRMAGDPRRLRPHVKTHKTREIVKLELAAGVGKHKVATLAEAEMVAGCGAPDVLLAYPVVGPNVGRLIRLIQAYPGCRFSVTMDDAEAVKALSAAVAGAGLTLDVLLDLDVGMHRTGIAPGPEAATLCEQIHRSPGLRAGGFHVYDGHNHQVSLAEREAAVRELMKPVLAFRAEMEAKGVPVPRLVAGGTPTFPVFAHGPAGTRVLSGHARAPRPWLRLQIRRNERLRPGRVAAHQGHQQTDADPADA